MSSYDAIAELYDPWSASVVEDVAFYLEEARRSGGPVVELGVGTGRIAVPIAADGIRVIGVDSSRGMLDVCARRAALAGVEIDLASAIYASRRSTSVFRSSSARFARCSTCTPTRIG